MAADTADLAILGAGCKSRIWPVFHIDKAVIRLFEAAALAAVATDSKGALRLAMLASELRAGVAK